MRLRRLLWETMVVALPIGCGARVGDEVAPSVSPTVAHADASSARDTAEGELDTGSFVEPKPDATLVDDASPDGDPAWVDASASDAESFDACGATDGTFSGDAATCGSGLRYTEPLPCEPIGDAPGPIYPTGPSEADALCAAVCARGFGVGDAGPLSCPSYGYSSRTCSITGGSITCYQSCSCGAGGRKPRGFSERSHGGAALAAFHARMADLEAVSVDAFRILRGELAAHGAPKALLRRCSKSARDEVRHARAMRRLARRFGAPRKEPQVVGRGPTRSMEEIARENAIEGCVRETWGAALAVLQGSRARDLSIRAAMRKIAADETRHAELSWSIATFLDGKLDRAARARVREQRSKAVRDLRDDVARGFDASLVEHAGLPPRQEALALFDALAARLWA